MAHLAFFTFTVSKFPQGDSRLQGFFKRYPSVIKQAQASEGFITLLNPETEKYAPLSPFTKGRPVGEILTLWKDIESVYRFTYQKLHGEALSHRDAWFLKGKWPSYAAWWVEESHYPTGKEAHERHQYLFQKGPSPVAFNFKKAFDKDGNLYANFKH